MASARKIVSIFVGGMQCVLGGLASVFVYLIYAGPLNGSLSIREMLSITLEEVPLFMFLLLVFAMLSILSGLLLVQEGNGV